MDIRKNIGGCYQLSQAEQVAVVPYSNFITAVTYISFYRGGYISGDCSAGYFCLAGVQDYTPQDQQPFPTVANCTPGEFCGGPCPSGHYCPEGVPDPIMCPNDTVRLTPGARQYNECIPCPAGFWCLQGILFSGFLYKHLCLKI